MTQDVTRASHSTRVLDGGLCLAVAGELDVTIVRDLDAWLAETGSTLAPGARFTIDLSGVTFCDAGCTAVLARHYYRLRATGVQVHAIGVQGMVAEVFMLLGLGDLIAP